MNFSVNLNRQFYVVESVGTATPTSVKGIFVGKDANNNVYFEHYGAGGLTRSDFINKNNILHAKVTAPEAMQHKMKYVDVVLDSNVNSGKPISGEDYILRIVIHSYVGMSDLEPYFKFGAVHATSSMTASQFYAKMAKSLAQNFARELAPMLKFELLTASDPVEVKASTKESTLNGTYTGIRITEVEQEWRRGIKEQVYVRFDVIPLTVTNDGAEVVWGTTTEGESSTNVLNNGKKIADLEYFCMGERGDQYRTNNWPNNIDTEYLVDPTKAYYVLDIHFAFVGEGTHVQKSEKTITFVSPTKATINSLITKFNTAAGTSIASAS